MARAKEILPAALFSVPANSSKYEGGKKEKFFFLFLRCLWNLYLYFQVIIYVKMLHHCIHTLRNINTECWEKIKQPVKLV